MAPVIEVAGPSGSRAPRPTPDGRSVDSPDRSPRRVNPMACTPEERAEIRRRNGRRSRGPITDAGKSISRMNAFTHGMRGDLLLMPEEDRDAVHALFDRWRD